MDFKKRYLDEQEKYYFDTYWKNAYKTNKFVSYLYNISPKTVWQFKNGQFIWTRDLDYYL